MLARIDAVKTVLLQRDSAKRMQEFAVFHAHIDSAIEASDLLSFPFLFPAIAVYNVNVYFTTALLKCLLLHTVPVSYTHLTLPTILLV